MHDLAAPCVDRALRTPELGGFPAIGATVGRAGNDGPVGEWPLPGDPARLAGMATDHQLSLTEHVPESGRPRRAAGRPGPRLTRPGRQLRPGRPAARRPPHRLLRPPRLPPLASRGPRPRDPRRPRRRPAGGDRRSARASSSVTATAATSPSGPRCAREARGRSWPWPPSSRRCPGSGTWASPTERLQVGRPRNDDPAAGGRAVLPPHGRRLGMGPPPRGDQGGTSGRRAGAGRRTRRHPGRRTHRSTSPPSPSPAVFGRGSESVPHHRASADWLVAHVPDAELIEIDGAAHGAHLTHPDAFAAVRPGGRGQGEAITTRRPRFGAGVEQTTCTCS